MADTVVAELQRVLVADTAVAAIAEGRIYAAANPPIGESNYPCVTVSRRLSGEQTPWRYGEFPLTIVAAAKNSDEACDLYEAVQNALDGYRGSAGGKYWYVVCDETPVVSSDTEAVTIHYYYGDCRVRVLG
jgi:hypothetical protein